MSIVLRSHSWSGENVNVNPKVVAPRMTRIYGEINEGARKTVVHPSQSSSTAVNGVTTKNPNCSFSLKEKGAKR